MLHEPLKDRARHHWQAILSALGMDSKAMSGRHGPCPMCGGRDRFRFDNKDGRGTWICSQCGAGDGIELVKRLQGVEFKEAARLIEQHIGTAYIASTRGRQAPTEAEKREEMIALWKRARPIEEWDHAGRYLNARTGLREFPAALRFSPDERYSEPGSRPTWHPVIVAKVDPSDKAAKGGQRAALHRTYITSDGRKAEVGSPRKMMGSMPTGAAVRLMPPTADGLLGIAEGIETALSASILFNVPTWAALTAGLLQEWTPPDGIKMVYIFGDNDRSNTGQAAAYTLAAKLKSRGIEPVVHFPPAMGQDWNDILMNKLEAA